MTFGAREFHTRFRGNGREASPNGKLSCMRLFKHRLSPPDPRFVIEDLERAHSIDPGKVPSGEGSLRRSCQMALDMFRLTKDDLVPQVKDVLTAMDFMDMSEGTQIIFV